MAFTGNEFITPALIYKNPGMDIYDLTDKYRELFPDNVLINELYLLTCHLFIDFKDKPYVHYISKQDRPVSYDDRFHYYYFILNSLGLELKDYSEINESISNMPLDSLVKEIPKSGEFSYATSGVFFEQRPPWHSVNNKFYLDEAKLLDCEDQFSFFDNECYEDHEKKNFGEFIFDSISFTSELIERGLTQYFNHYVPFEKLDLIVPNLCKLHPELIPNRVNTIKSFWISKYCRKKGMSYNDYLRISLSSKKVSEDKLIENELEAIEREFGKRLSSFDPYRLIKEFIYDYSKNPFE
ncbi:hypothetical protein KY334_06370 [Candidatus Woesearchaeota archaeon]|nr:hypothetical protein [Candidatus Woesearchaeota archaeon]